ncbi:hypothetical protein ACBJ59_12105 [Nonomuraea sp. MTCD27]|uniref:hypothetical protein n=1 Tax=Nonomuraea sp. MTCD27 TaxID=1676747 RepID=UPI0035C11702
MSQLDQFPDNQNRIVRDLERRIEQLEAQVKNRPGAAVSRASGSFFLPDGAVSGQAGGMTMGGSGGQFRVVDHLGNIIELPMSAQAPISLTDASSVYDGTAQALINALKAGHNDLLNRMKVYRLMRPF